MGFQENANGQNAGALVTIFSLLPVMAGFIGGFQYPLATHLISAGDIEKKSTIGKHAGVLYAVDSFGASAGALLTGVFLIPLLGIKEVCFFSAALNTAVFILLILSPQPAK